MKYHIYRHPKPFSEPLKTEVECVRCGKQLDALPSPPALSADPCSTQGMWKPPEWYGADGLPKERSVPRMNGLKAIAEHKLHTIAKIQERFNVKEAGIAQVKADLDWLAFNGLLEVEKEKFRVSALGFWTMPDLAEKLGILRPSRQPSVLTPEETKHLNAARAARAYSLRKKGDKPRVNTNRDLLRAHLLTLKVPADKIDALADGIADKFSLRLKK